MQYISTTDPQASLSQIINAAQKEPVVIQRQDQDVAVMISPKEYARLRRIRVREFNDVCTRASEYAKMQGMTEEKLAELLSDES